MPILYRFPEEDLPAAAAPPLSFDDDSSDWWAGAKQCFASIAIAAALTLTASQTLVAARAPFSQDELPGTLSGCPDEDAGIVQPPRLTYPSVAVFSADDDLPAAPAFCADDDAQFGAIYPSPRTLFIQLGDADDYFAPPQLPVEEESWTNPVAPAPWQNAWPQQFAFDVQEPAGSLYGQPDEDFWANPVRPIQASLLWPNPAFDAGEIAYAPATAPPEEDFWANPARPVPGAIYQRLPYGPDPEELPSGSLYNPIEEEPWTNPAPLAAVAPYRQLPYAPDPDEIPAGSIAIEEDSWPAAPRLCVQPGSAAQPFIDRDDACFAPAAPGVFEEDCWQALAVAARWPSPQLQPWIFDSQERPVPLAGPLDWMVATAGTSQAVIPMEGIAGGVAYGMVAIAGGVNVVGE